MNRHAWILLGCTLLAPLIAEGDSRTLLQHQNQTVVVDLRESDVEIQVKNIEPDSVLTETVLDPTRFVLDIKAPGTRPVRRRPLIENLCVEKLRTGVYTDKVRLVFDQKSNAQCELSRSETPHGSVITIRPVSTQDNNAPAPSPTPVPTPSVMPEPPAATTPPMAESQPTVGTIPTSTPAAEVRVLKAIEFVRDGDLAEVHLRLTERSPFKLTRENARKYRLTIPDNTLEGPGLSLPHFPPNDFVGFTLIQASANKGSVEVVVGLDDGMKVSAVNKDAVIVIRAEPAGF